MAEGNLTGDQREALKNAFDDIDIDKSGKISKSELRAVLQLIGQNPTPEDMRDYMQKCGDGEFTKDDFCEFIDQHIHIKTTEEIQKDLRDAFEKFDEDRDNLISQEEFRKIMTKMGDESLSEAEADKLLENLDTHVKDGQLDIDELSKMFME